MNKSEMEQLIDNIARQASKSSNYHGFDSDLQFDSDLGFDDEDSVLSMDETDSVLDMAGAGASKTKGLSTYGINILYVDGGGGLGNPVQVELFGTDFNTGTQVGDTLVFTNNFGDQAIVSGRTTSFIAFQNRLRYAPFKIGYARLNPENAAQFNQELRYQMDSVYGGGQFNTQLPEEYFTPDQFQALRVDVPMNYTVDSEKRIIFNLGATEATVGMNITFWVTGLEKMINALKGKPTTIDMTGRGIQQRSPSQPTRTMLAKMMKVQLATNKMMAKQIQQIANR